MNKLLYSRKEAAAALSLSTSTLDVMIRSGQLRARYAGRRVMVPAAEIERWAKRDHGPIWPPDRNGKTTRHFAEW